MSAQDSRTLRQRVTDAVLGFLEDQRPVRTVTARKQSHNAFLIGVDVGACEELRDRVIR
ncbi:hypothetical protein BH11ACT8_BH11ACT8_04410 [soil metagenome]